MKAAGNRPPIEIKSQYIMPVVPRPPLAVSMSTGLTSHRPTGTDKDRWIMNERLRWAKYFSVPINADTPEGFPPLTLNVMRSIVAMGHLADNGQPLSSQPAQAAIVKALDAFFEAYWVKNRNVVDKDVMADILKAAGADVAKVTELSAGGEAKQTLLRNTDQAFADGAFGLPWFVCENDEGEREGFWGVDHLGVVLDFLGLEKPRAGGWRAML
jgi:2-hydroxychromene-2-carboxylate isomerase